MRSHAGWLALRHFGASALQRTRATCMAREHPPKCHALMLTASPSWRASRAGVKTVVDQSLLDQGAEINFNAGLRTVSVLHLPVAEYLRIEKPHVLSFT